MTIKVTEGASPAEDTLKPQAGSGGGDTGKAEMIAWMAAAMANMPMEDLTHFFNDSIAQIGQEAVNIPDGAAASNMASIATKGAVKEDVEAMFSSDDLSEELKEKATVIFEAAVNARLIIETAALEESFEQKLTESTLEITEKLDAYLEYVIENWKKDNEIAIEKSIRTDILENFVSGLHDLFLESNMNIPEDSLDVVAEQHTEIEDLKERLNKAINEKLELETLVIEAQKELVFDEVTEGLAATQVEKLKSLCEGVEDNDPDSYKKKVLIIKENYFKTSRPEGKNLLIEDENGLIETKSDSVSPMSNYVKAISKTTVK